MTQSDRPKRARWAGAVAVAVALWASAAPTLIYPVYVSEWSLSTFATMLIFSTYPLFVIVAMALFGTLSESVGARAVIVSGLVLVATGTLGMILATSLPLLLIGRAVMGFGVGLFLGPATAVIARAETAVGKTRTGAITAFASSTGLVAALLIGGVTVAHSSDPLRMGLMLLLGVAAAAAVLARLLLPAEKTAVRSWAPRRLTIPANRRLFLVGASAVSAAYGLGALFLGIGSQFARDAVGSSDALVTGLVLAISAVSIGITAVAAARVPLKWGILGGAALAVVGQVLMLGAGPTHLVPLFAASGVVGGAGYSLLFSAGVNAITGSAALPDRASVASTGYLISYAFQAVVALSVGIVTSAGGLMLGLLTGTVLVLAAVGCAVITRIRIASAPPAVSAER